MTARISGAGPGDAARLRDMGYGEDEITQLIADPAAMLPASANGSGPAVPALPAAFWDARPELATIRDFARARRVSPTALLGAVLARVVTAVPSAVRLPALVGGPASLNLFVGLVGASGDGKGSVEAAAELLLPVIIETAQVGSGEGIAHLFATRTRTGVERTADAALMQVTEIDTLGALQSRQGSTLLPELRKAYMGEALGFSYATKDRRLPIAPHSYRLCLIAGIQPPRGGVLLGDADGGSPQRFVWLHVADPDAPDVAPEAPAVLKWQGLPLELDMVDQPVEMAVCDTARQAIDAARLARLRGNGLGLDAHALLTREKVAAALALLAHRPDLGEDDWALAGAVMAVSDRTRELVQAGVRDAARTVNKVRGEAEADRAVIVSERAEEAIMRRTCQVIMRRLDRADDWVGHADLRRSLRPEHRTRFDDAVDILQQGGQVKSAPVESGQSGTRYRRAQ